jgi:hypothetical protein
MLLFIAALVAGARRSPPAATDRPTSAPARSVPREDAFAPIEALLPRASSPAAPPGRLPKFAIVSVSPTTLSARGNEAVTIDLNASLTPPLFCRFGQTVVTARVLSAARLECRSPRLPEGELLLAVSADKAKWCPAVVLSAVADDADLSWVVVALAGFAVLSISLLALRMLCGKRAVPKRRRAKRRTLEKAHPPDLHHRRNLPSIL